MDIFLARQAIYDKKENIIAYELLYRSSNLNRFTGSISEDDATMKLISNTATIGLDQIINKRRAFINFSEGVLLKDIASLLHKDSVVIEVLESVNPTKEVLARLKNLREKGYIIALDDVTFNSKYKGFGDLIDIYKIDFMLTTKTQRKLLLNILKGFNPKAKFLAEKIETDDDFIEAVENKYDYYQGYYFSKPLMILGKDVLLNNTNCFNIMSELHKDYMDVDSIEQIMKTDISLTYKLMKFLNSSIFSFLQSISSIKQAIMLLGTKELKKWLSLVIITGMKSENDSDITYNTIIRGRFCELIGGHLDPKMMPLAFLTGLFSNLDSFTGKSMEEICRDMPIDDDIKDALLGKENNLKYILDLVIAYEKVDFKGINEYSGKLGIHKNIVVDYYLQSLNWTGKVFETM